MTISVNQHRQEQPPMIRGLSCIPSFVGTNGTPNALSKQFEGKSSNSPDTGGGLIIGSLTLKGGNIKDTDWASCSSSSSSSSIGQNSGSGNPSTLTSCYVDGYGGDMEVQSSYKGPLDTLTALEDSLPIKRGISNFFSGKSKSFTSLSDAVSIKDLAKPENAYNKRRRNLLACGSNWDKHRFCSRNGSSGISKKAIHSSKSTLALAVAMSNSQCNSEGFKHDLQTPPLPPLPPQVKSHSSAVLPRSFSVRSFSLTDLQGINCQPNFARI